MRAIATSKLYWLEHWLNGHQQPDDSQRAHFVFAAEQIRHFKDDPSKFSVTQPSEAPAGAPIGMGEHPLPGMCCDWR